MQPSHRIARARSAAALLLLLGVSSSVLCSAEQGAEEESWAMALPAAVQPQLLTTAAAAASAEQRRQRRFRRRTLWEWPAEWSWQQSPAQAAGTPTAATTGSTEATIAAVPPPPSPPSVVELPSLHQRWQTYRERLGAISVDGRPLASTLGMLLSSYRFSVGVPELRRGLVYSGSQQRLRRVLMRALQGERRLSVVVVGGSISWGQGASARGIDDWFSVLSRYLTAALPGTNVSTHNGAVPATPSSYMALCLEHSMPDDADLVFVEYVLNDGVEDALKHNGHVKMYERLLRRILDWPSQPAVVLMQVHAHGVLHPRGHAAHRPYHETMEDLYGSLAQFYDTAWLSLRNLMTALLGDNDVSARPGGWSRSELLDADFLHPSSLGHKMMADLAVWLLQQVAMDLVLFPYGVEDEAGLAAPLPAPMVPGNHHPRRSVCIHYQGLADYVLSADPAWQMVNEGTADKPKWGYVSTTPGSTIKFALSRETLLPGGAPAAGELPSVTVMLAHLRSYQHMGQAEISCGGSCFCPLQVVNGHQQLQESTTYLAHVTALLQSPADCVLAVTVLNTTDSGETKFKVTGLLVSDSDVGFVESMPWGEMETHLASGLRRSELVEHHHRRNARGSGDV